MKKVIIVGAGNIAGLNESDPVRDKPCTHAGGYLHNSSFNLAGVVDLDINRAKEFSKLLGVPNYYSDVESALSEIRPDIVSVTTPYQVHHKIITQLVNSPFPPSEILCEKPISDSLANAERMLTECQSKGIQLFVNNRRLLPIYKHAVNLIDDELGGEIISISGWCSSGLHAIGIHMIDIFRYFCGDIEWVDAVEEIDHVKSLPYSHNFVENDPRTSALIGFKNGVVGTFVNSALKNFTYFEIEIVGRNGKMRISDNGNKLEIWQSVEPGESTLSYKLGAPENIEVTPEPLFTGLISALATPTGSLERSLISGYEAVESYRVLDLFLRSSLTQNRVYLE